MLDVVLVEPEIPQNTGSIGRLCVGAGCRLHLIEPLGFSLGDRYLRRAGLDYWEHVDLAVHPSWDAFENCFPSVRERGHFLSKKAGTPYTRATFRTGDLLVFGRETDGLPAHLLERFAGRTLRIPIWGPVRSYNLSNAVSVVVMEALRQIRPGDF